MKRFSWQIFHARLTSVCSKTRRAASPTKRGEEQASPSLQCPSSRQQNKYQVADSTEETGHRPAGSSANKVSVAFLLIGPPRLDHYRNAGITDTVMPLALTVKLRSTSSTSRTNPHKFWEELTAYFPSCATRTQQKTTPPTILRCQGNVFTKLLHSSDMGNTLYRASA
jgi:hypothetical protein